MLPFATIIIPTHNRPQFLKRLLLFLSSVQCPSPIVVVDSSDSSTANLSEAVVSDVQSQLSINYIHNRQRFEVKCMETLQATATPYVVLCADDDFVNPFAIEPCISFLEGNPNYALTRGVQFIQATDRERRIKPARFRDLDVSDPARRFSYFADNWYSTFYCVHRTPELLKDFRITCEHTNSEHAIILPELLLTYLSVIRGCTRYLPHFFGMRQRHASAASCISPRITDTANYDAHYRRFVQCVTRELSAASTLSEEESGRLVERCHGRNRTTWESSAGKKQSGLAGVMRETARPLRKAVGVFRHGSMRHKWKTHPNLKGMENDDTFRLMTQLIDTFPGGCDMDADWKNGEAA